MPALSPIFDRLLNIFDVERNAIVRKVINGHQFEATLLGEPTKCSHCNQHIWIPYGQKCKFCRLSSHSKCLGLIKTRCVMGPGGPQVPSREAAGQRDHDLRETGTFIRLCTSLINPTRTGAALLCDHCGTCILTPRYHECTLCSRIFHNDCLRMASSDCDLGRGSSQAGESAQVYEHTSGLAIGSFEILGHLGKGSFSTVYLARLRQSAGGDTNRYAIKVIKKTNSMIISNPKYAFTEWRALNLGRSYPFLTVGHCCFQARDRLYFVMEYVPGRDLLHYVHNQAPFPEDRARFHAAEIVLALVYLHRKHKVIYRDLKLNNIILDPFGHCKLIDFGMAKFLTPDCVKTNTFSGTPYYLSPEVLSGQPYDFSVDWWALGVIMYEMLCVHQPFTGDSNEEIFEAIRTRDLTYPSQIRLTDRARSILDGLLTKDPRQRLGCQLMEGCSEEIERHPFFLFQSRDGRGETHLWNELEKKQVGPPYIPPATKEPRCPREPKFSPIKADHFNEVRQDDFDNFSSYSESFTDELGQLKCPAVADT